MQVQTVVRLISVKQGKNKNWLEFECFIGKFDGSRIFYIEFMGTDLSTNASLLDDQKEDLRLKLCDDFGYAPYDLQKAKEVLGDGKCYKITDF